MKSKLREEIETITPEGGGVSQEAARTRDMLLDYVQWKARKAQIAQAEQAQLRQRRSNREPFHRAPVPRRDGSKSVHIERGLC